MTEHAIEDNANFIMIAITAFQKKKKLCAAHRAHFIYEPNSQYYMHMLRGWVALP